MKTALNWMLRSVVMTAAIAVSTLASATSFNVIADGDILGTLTTEIRDNKFLWVSYTDNSGETVNLSSISFSYLNNGDKSPSQMTLTLGDPSLSEAFTKVGGANAKFVGITGYVVASPVPEPETYALMLAGLGVVGWAVRGRKQATSVPAYALPA